MNYYLNVEGSSWWLKYYTLEERCEAAIFNEHNNFKLFFNNKNFPLKLDSGELYAYSQIVDKEFYKLIERLMQ